MHFNDQSPVKINESVEQIEAQLGGLLAQEIVNPELVRRSETYLINKDLLINHGFILEEGEDTIVLKGNKDGRTFSIKWSPANAAADAEDYNPSDFEDEEDEDEEENEGEDEDEEQEDEENDERPPPVCELEVSVTKSNGSVLYLQCGANQDGQMLVFRMGNATDTLVDVSDLPEDVQHRMYDYLDELGVNDGIANFINLHNEFTTEKRHVDTLRYVSNFFLKD